MRPLTTLGRNCSFLGTVAVGISGGVDSAVSALLLKKKGYNVVGVHMTNWDHEEESSTAGPRKGRCEGQDALVSAATTARILEIPLKRVNFVDKYWNEVFIPCIEDYKSGTKTPNPDIMCNEVIKFRYFLHYALQVLGADFMATGHFAQVSSLGLSRATVRASDQSYFLSTVPREAFKKALFPVGHLSKDEVRDIARNNGLPAFSRKSSTGLCFVGQRAKFGDFLEQYIDDSACEQGDIIDIDSQEIVGRHTGLWRLTLGQRAGIPGKSKPQYVVCKNHSENTIMVSSNPRHELLYPRRFTIGSLSITSPAQLASTKSLYCQTRYRENAVRCQVELHESNQVVVKTEEGIHAPTPGQTVAFYDNDVLCLGSGIIC